MTDPTYATRAAADGLASAASNPGCALTATLILRRTAVDPRRLLAPEKPGSAHGVGLPL
jgi:hypothetical protein